MPSIHYYRPILTTREVTGFVQAAYGLAVTASALPGERDQNFYLRDTAGVEYVLKIAHAAEDRAALDFENLVLTHLASHAPDLALPHVQASLMGEDLTTLRSSDGVAHLARLLTFVPGRLWVDVRPHTPDLLHSLGETLGRLNVALRGFDHPGAHRDFKWNVAQTGWTADYLHFIQDTTRRALAGRILDQFESQVLPRLPDLPSSVIYNDANDYNVLVSEGDPRRRHVVGVIDFGDMVYAPTVCDLAVGLAYAMLDQVDPIEAATHVVRGYHSVWPLNEAELAVLYPLACARLLISVTNAAHQGQAQPDHAYLTIHESRAWALIEKLAQVPAAFAHYTFRNACGLPACPQTPALVQWLQTHPADLGPVVDLDPQTPPLVFDLSIGSLELGNNADFADTVGFTRRLFERMTTAGTTVGVGRYNEARPIYTTDLFRVEGNSGPEWRTVHLGLDLFRAVGSPVYAPLDGVIHSFVDNTAPLDYGPTLILEHTVAEGALTFYTLYGHLSRDSLDGLVEGKTIRRSERIGTIGDMAVNGGWPPHLHFQVIADLLDRRGEFPGVGLPSQRPVWLSLCPDPNLVLRLPVPTATVEGPTADELLARRHRRLGPNLSVSYHRPLKIVRGYRQHLYDEDGRRYLDTVNNVAHVGHSHPRVVRAGQAQMAVLNTNSRYLHDNLTRYAERLCATLPEPLRVCYFVCSGSEANELALRLARSYTGSPATLVVDVAYHGNTGGLIDISPYKHAGPGGRGAPPYVHTLPMPDVYRGPYKADDPQAGEKYARSIETAIKQSRALPSDSAEPPFGMFSDGGWMTYPPGADPGVRGRRGTRAGAPTFICESILSCGGQIVLPPGYLAAVYRHIRAVGGVCIADEVQVGFGRVGSHFWAFETQGVVPDIVTMGKPIGNGHPLAAVVTTPEIAAAFDNGMEYFNTFGGNPVSCAIGLAVLDVIEDEGLQSRAAEVGAYLMDGLRNLQQRHPIIGDVRGLGLFVGFELVLDRATLMPAPEQASYLANRMRDYGILMSTDGPWHNVLKIKPPLVFTREDVDFLIGTLDTVLSEDFMRTTL